MAKVPSPKAVAAWAESINKSGVKRINARALLKAFGAERRGSAVVERIHRWCESQRPKLHPNGLRFLRSLDDQVQLSFRPITQIGGLVEYESELCQRFPNEIMPHLGPLRLVKAEFSPEGTREKFDFLCEAPDGTRVIVELKRDEGERRSVEQVIGYIRSLREDGKHRNAKIRGILVTGRADLNTRKVLEELEPDYHIDWFVYGLDETNKIRVEHVAVTPARRA